MNGGACTITSSTNDHTQENIRKFRDIYESIEQNLDFQSVNTKFRSTKMLLYTKGDRELLDTDKELTSKTISTLHSFMPHPTP